MLIQKLFIKSEHQLNMLMLLRKYTGTIELDQICFRPSETLTQTKSRDYIPITKLC